MTPDGSGRLTAEKSEGKVLSALNGAASPPVRPENANVLPGGTENTAGGQQQAITVADAARSIRLKEFKELHKKPCVRDAALTGIGTGFGVGGLAAVLGSE